VLCQRLKGGDKVSGGAGMPGLSAGGARRAAVDAARSCRLGRRRRQTPGHTQGRTGSRAPTPGSDAWHAACLLTPYDVKTAKLPPLADPCLRSGIADVER